MSPSRISDCSLLSSINFGNSPTSESYERFFDEKGEEGGSCETGSDDILDLLPADPFGMDMRYSKIKGWVEDVKDVGLSSCGCRSDEAELKKVDAGLHVEWSLHWNDQRRFHSEKGSMNFFGNPILNNTLYGDSFVSNVNVDEECPILREVRDWIVNEQAKLLQDYLKISRDSEGSVPHDALYFALGHLGVRDLLSIERVCRSLRDAVKSDTLLWRRIHIDSPLSEIITDDALLQLTSRAQGGLQCLSLVQCSKITDDGLKRVLECNPRLTKLSVPGCVRLTVEGIVSNLKAFKSAGTQGIKHLRIGGMLDVTDKHFEELKFLLGADNHKQLRAYKPRFYCGDQLYLNDDDDCPIDIEMCPQCEVGKLVYDCPTETCQGKHQTNQLCKACVCCIARCYLCGRCFKECDFVETFSFENLCMHCYKSLPHPEELNEIGGSSKL